MGRAKANDPFDEMSREPIGISGGACGTENARIAKLQAEKSGARRVQLPVSRGQARFLEAPALVERIAKTGNLVCGGGAATSQGARVVAMLVSEEDARKLLGRGANGQQARRQLPGAQPGIDKECRGTPLRTRVDFLRSLASVITSNIQHLLQQDQNSRQGIAATGRNMATCGRGSMRQYVHRLLRLCEANGKFKADRTDGNVFNFGAQERFDLRESFPLRTTTRLHLRSIIHELLWFLKGDTNVQYSSVRTRSPFGKNGHEKAPWQDHGAQWRDWRRPDGVAWIRLRDLSRTLRGRRIVAG